MVEIDQHRTQHQEARLPPILLPEQASQEEWDGKMKCVMDDVPEDVRCDIQDP